MEAVQVSGSVPAVDDVRPIARENYRSFSVDVSQRQVDGSRQMI